MSKKVQKEMNIDKNGNLELTTITTEKILIKKKDIFKYIEQPQLLQEEPINECYYDEFGNYIGCEGYCNSCTDKPCNKHQKPNVNNINIQPETPKIMIFPEMWSNSFVPVNPGIPIFPITSNNNSKNKDTKDTTPPKVRTFKKQIEKMNDDLCTHIKDGKILVEYIDGCTVKCQRCDREFELIDIFNTVIGKDLLNSWNYILDIVNSIFVFSLDFPLYNEERRFLDKIKYMARNKVTLNDKDKLMIINIYEGLRLKLLKSGKEYEIKYKK